jgi:cell division protein FtsB
MAACGSLSAPTTHADTRDEKATNENTATLRQRVAVLEAENTLLRENLDHERERSTEALRIAAGLQAEALEDQRTARELEDAVHRPWWRLPV